MQRGTVDVTTEDVVFVAENVSKTLSSELLRCHYFIFQHDTTTLEDSGQSFSSAEDDNGNCYCFNTFSI